MKILPALLLLTSTLPAFAAYDGPPAEKAKWVAFCVDGLKDTGEKERARGVYCRCMSDYVRHRRPSPPVRMGTDVSAGAFRLL